MQIRDARLAGRGEARVRDQFARSRPRPRSRRPTDWGLMPHVSPVIGGAHRECTPRAGLTDTMLGENRSGERR